MVHIFYEMSVHILLLVFFAFWFLEFPASLATGRDINFKVPEWFGFIYSHTFPEIFVSVEFIFSSIRFEFKRYWLYFLCGLTILTINIFVTLYESQPYASMNWDDEVGTSILAALAIFIM